VNQLCLIGQRRRHPGDKIMDVIRQLKFASLLEVAGNDTPSRHNRRSSMFEFMRPV
jgi:hypothetical protein